MSSVTALRPSRPTMLPTNAMSRDPASQVRAHADNDTILEYAEAMIAGAKFPPVVVYQDADGVLYLADGIHRLDATNLAALKDPHRKPELLCEIRQGSRQDAVRHALSANQAHGKRMSEKDFGFAAKLALVAGLIDVPHANEVAPALAHLIGCSVYRARECSADYRKAMLAKRDRLILAMHGEGRTQETIGAALNVPQQTISRVIGNLTQNGDVPVLGKVSRGERPQAKWPEAEEAPEKVNATVADRLPNHATADVSVLLPLFDRRYALPAAKEEDDAIGTVSRMDEAPPAASDPAAVRALAMMVKTLTGAVNALDRLDGLETPFSREAATAALDALEVAEDFFGRLNDYIRKE